MRRPISNNPARAHQSLATGALTPHEAATRLARVEFDTARLEREIAVAKRRIEKARSQLQRHEADRVVLLGVIARAPRSKPVGAKTNAA